MSHKLTSDQAVIYDASSQATSVLVITPNSTQFQDNEGYRMGNQEHQVQINATIWANYSSSTSQQINRLNYSLDEAVWNEFASSQSLDATDSYDQVVETALLWVADNIQPLYGLSASNWIYSND